MADAYTSRNRFEKPEPGAYADTWASRVNGQFGSDLLDAAMDGVESFALSGSKTLSTANGAPDEARKRVLNVTSGSGGTITIPNLEKLYFIRNNSSGTVTITTGSGTSAAISTGANKLVFCDGANACYADATVFSTLSTSGNVTLGDSATVDTHAINGATTIAGPIGDHTTQNSTTAAVLTLKPSATGDTSDIRLLFWTGDGAIGHITLDPISDASGASDMYLYSRNSAAGFQIVLKSAGEVYFPTVGTTASAANAFLDSGTSNSLKRSTSSQEYKTGIEDVDPSYAEAALNIRPVYYRSKVSTDNPDHSHWGYIAEEIAEIDPRLVHWGYHEDDFEKVSVSFMEKEDTGEVGEDGKTIFREVERTEERRRLKEGATLKPDGAQYERIHVLKIEALRRQVEALTARLDALAA